MTLQYQSYQGLLQEDDSSIKAVNLEKFKRDGYFILKNAIPHVLIDEIRHKIDDVWLFQEKEFGKDFLISLGEYGQVRCMMEKDPIFFQLIRYPIIFEYVSAVVGNTAILHLQNGIILFPDKKHNQAKFHKDFPRDFLSNKILSINALIVIDSFNSETGGTWLVPGSHLFDEMPSGTYLENNKVQLEANPGDVLIFNSLLWHKGGDNITKHPRRAINQQYTRPFIKQQIDYPNLLEKNIHVNLESPLAQTLGFWTVPPKNLQQFRVKDASLRTYRAGQG